MSMMAVPSVGVGYYDANGDWQPDESPYPVVFDSGAGTLSYPAGTSPPIDWAAILGNAFSGINNTLAITQGGSVTPTGVYGSPGTASIAASGYPAAGIGASIGGLFNSPVLLLGIVGIVFIMASKSK